MPGGVQGDPGKNGDPGGKGEDGKVLPAMFAESVQQITRGQVATLALSRQLAMLLHSAEGDYLNGRIDPAIEKLGWICWMTEEHPPDSMIPLRPLISQDPVKNLHQQQLRPILRERAALLLQQIRSGFDYFGYAPQYVELVDKSFYDKYLESLTAIGKSVEQQQERFWRLREDLAGRKKALQESIDGLHLLKARREEEIKVTGKTANLLQDEIAVLHVRIGELQAQLEASDQAFKAAVEKQSGGCSFKRVIGVITTIVTVVGTLQSAGTSLAAMGGGWMAFAKASSKSQEEIAKLNEVDLAKFEQDKNFLRMVRQTSATAGEIGRAYESIESLLKGAEDNRAKLVMSRQQYVETLDPYMKLPEAQQLRTLLDALFGAIEARNNKVIEYTAACLREAQLRSELAQSELEVNQLASALLFTRNDELDACGIFLDTALGKLKLQIIKGLYFANKSLEFYGLGAVNLNVRDKSIAELEVARANWKIEEANILARRGTADRMFGSRKVIFDQANSPDLLQQFRSNGIVTVAIPLQHPAFSGAMREIRAAKLRIWLEGAHSESGWISVQAQQQGTSAFLTVMGESVNFLHRPRSHFWRYELASGKSDDSAELGGKTDLFVNISPFSTWTLKLVEGDNRLADLANLKAIVFEFEGTFLPARI